jgi:oligopeptide transport system substrate-binding protein
MRSKFYVLFAILAIASVVLAACTPSATPTPQTITVVVEKEGTPVVQVVTATPGPVVETQEPTGPKSLTLNMGPGDIPTLDPAVSEDTSSIQVIEETIVGLTRQNELTAATEPGIATSWDVSDDGLTYTFHLRNDVPWVRYNGNEVEKVVDCEGADRLVKAQDFVYGALRTLAPATASPYAYVLSFVLKGGADFNATEGVDPTTVGIRAVDDFTLEMVFNEAAAYNAAIAGMWVARPEPQWLIEGDDCTEARGERWFETGFFQSYGPYTLKEWVHDSELTLVKNPFWPGSDAIPVAKIDEIRWTMLDESPAFAEYEAGNIDVAAVPLADIDRVKADPTLSAELKIAPVFCTYYYGFNTKADVVSDQRVRLALSQAIDRQGLIDNVTKGGQEPAQWLARPGLAGAPTMDDHPDLGVKFDAAGAKALLQSYLDEKGVTADSLNLELVFNTSSGHQKIAEAIQQMWKDNLGVNVKLSSQEWAVFLKTTKDPVATPQIFRMGWCQDYPDANNFDKEAVGFGGSQNPAEGGGLNWKNDEYQTLINDAAKEMDAAKRVDMYAQAEEILVKTDAALIPIYWYTRVTVTKPYVDRTFSVLGGLEHIEKWDVAAH